MKKKDRNLLIVVLAVVVIFFAYQQGYFTNLNVTPPAQGGISVHTPVTFTLMDNVAGAAITTQNIIIYHNGLATETVQTDAHGQIATSLSYDSGEVLNCYVADGNAHYWTTVTLPKETQTQVDNNANMQVTINGYTAETYTGIVVCGSSSYATASSYNRTGGANATPTFSFDWNGVTNNKAMLAGSFDPLYNIQPQTMLFAVFNSTSIISTSGFDGSYIVGSSKVFYKTLNDNDFTYQTVGSTIVHSGSGAAVFALDTSSLPAVGTANCTMALYIFAYANADYAINHSASGATATAYGPLAIQLLTETITLNNG
jgi:hypothetical protein